MEQRSAWIIFVALLMLSGAIIWNGQSGKLVEAKPTAAKVEEQGASKDVLSFSEAAKYLQVSEEYLQFMIDREEDALKKTGAFVGMRLPYIKIGKKYVFSRDSLKLWLAEAAKENKAY
ncbi:helix-turn-helix domain-containing protein [Ectobacillus ponti]|uniref:Helix-turn-helix domain-containing protein n=1 Tax=Ectobacillus ponti TaxID=2961894 RepID=A0AA42BS13_9BACI|nr:helix-turn-helix domain-containing protein [Ectobacillus ponti]MCP8970089.1 helix-turn-helix domain-containing protein [Ectobacillus ponti]